MRFGVVSVNSFFSVNLIAFWAWCRTWWSQYKPTPISWIKLLLVLSLHCVFILGLFLFRQDPKLQRCMGKAVAGLCSEPFFPSPGWNLEELGILKIIRTRIYGFRCILNIWTFFLRAEYVLSRCHLIFFFISNILFSVACNHLCCPKLKLKF